MYNTTCTMYIYKYNLPGIYMKTNYNSMTETQSKLVK